MKYISLRYNLQQCYKRNFTATYHDGIARCKLCTSRMVTMFYQIEPFTVLQLCGAVFGWMEGKSELHNRNVFQRILSSLGGLARFVLFCCVFCPHISFSVLVCAKLLLSHQMHKNKYSLLFQPLH